MKLRRTIAAAGLLTLGLARCEVRTAEPAAAPPPPAPAAATPAAPQPPPLALSEAERRVREFQGLEPAVPRTPAELEAACLAVVDTLLPDLGADDPAKQKPPQQALQTICWRAARPGAEPERAAVARAVATRLATETRPPARFWLLLQLRHIGRNEAVAALVRCLSDPDRLTRESARQALAANPAPAATAALVEALRTAPDDDQRVAMANALGFRRDEAAVEALLALARGDADATRTAAAAALADIGSARAADALVEAAGRGSAPSRRLCTDALLRLAGRLCDRGEPAAALPLYRRFLAAEPLLQAAALVGLARAGGAAELPTLVTALDSPDFRVRGAALGALQRLPGDTVTQALCAESAKAPPTRRPLLLQALARRGDRAALPTLLAALASDAKPDRLAAYEGCSAFAAEEAAEAVVAGLTRPDPDEREAAARALAQIAGERPTAALVARLRQADAPGRLALLAALSARPSPTVPPTLLAAMEDPDRTVRTAAAEALRKLADERLLSPLVDLLGRTAEEDRPAVEQVLVAVCRRTTGDRPVADLAARLPKAAVLVRASILRVLGQTGQPLALQEITAAVRAPEPEVQDAAVRALTAWTGLDAAPALLDVARTPPREAHRTLALRALAQQLAGTAGTPADRRLTLYRASLEAAQRAEDRKLFLSGLAALGSPAAAELLKPCLADPALRTEAVAALLQLAEALATTDRPAAEALLRDIAQACPDPDTAGRVRDTAARLTQAGDQAEAWQVCGPFTSRDNKPGRDLFDAVFAPEDAAAKPPPKWVAIRAGLDKTKPWGLSLEHALGGSNRVAYLRTHVWSATARRVRLEVGSDDGIKVWLNGTVVLSRNAGRALKAGEDKVEADLQQGWNSLLLKVTQNGGHWAAALAVRAPGGAALDGLRYRAEPPPPAAADGTTPE